MSFRTRFLAVSLCSLFMVVGCGADKEEPAPKVSYSKNVSVILESHCQECHMPQSEGAEKSGFAVDTYESVMKGTKLGPVVVPGSAESSTLYRLVAGKADPSIMMPHGKQPLTKKEISTIKQWIDAGAPET